MSITFTDQLDKPSEITTIPNQLLRPIFGASYGFDTPQTPVSVFDGSLTFPTIQVFDTEAEFIGQTDAPEYTIVHAKDTDKLYVWENPNWIYFNQN